MKGKVYGRLVDDQDHPLSGIKLRAIADYSSFFADDPALGDALTDQEGNFEIKFKFDPKFMENDKNRVKIVFNIDEEPIMDISKEIEDEIVDFGIIKFHGGNIGVQGRVIDEEGNPIPGLTIIAEDIDLGKMELNPLDLVESKFRSLLKDDGFLNGSLDFIQDKYDALLAFRDDFLGSTITDANGYYRIVYPQKRYREILDKDPDIKIIVKDKLGVFELRKTKVHQNISTVIKKIDDIIINHAEIEGWLVTLKSNLSSRVSSKNNFQILIDNHEALQKIVQVIEEAESYVYLTQFEFYPDFVPRFFYSEGEYKSDDPLVYKLLEAQNRGVDCKIIINENRIVPDNYDELHSYFKDSQVEVRRFPAKGPYAMHAKVVVVDGKKGFVIGSPFSQSYWDTNKHHVKEPRRLNKNEGPLHDVSIYLEGPVIRDLEEFFRELWNYLSNLHFKGEDKIKGIKSTNKYTEMNLKDANPLLVARDQTLQVVRSITPGTVTKEGELGVLEAYRKAITNARDFIYFENQYFTNKYIIGALKKAIELNPQLQIIMVINEVPDVPTYRSWQHYGLEFLGLDLGKLIIEHPQIGVFAKWSGKFVNGKNRLRNCYIHSKATIVDDVWATIGTSNFDGSSLSCAEEFGSREASQNHRNMEMNVLMFDMDKPKTGTIENFRKTLWSEHLGMDIGNLKRPPQGWLKIWKEKSFQNIIQLEKEEIILEGGILPYSTANNSKEQIKDLIEQYRRIKGRFNV